MEEINRDDFLYVVPDFRLNKSLENLNRLSQQQKDKVEFLCNECCWFGPAKTGRNVTKQSAAEILERTARNIFLTALTEIRAIVFQKQWKIPDLSVLKIFKNTYLPMGFSNFKIEGRGLGSALILEFLLYYMTKPEYHLHVREKIYLDNTLDLF